MGGWIVSAKDLASGKVSWSPRENLRRMKAELIARRVELAVLPPKRPGGKPARSEVEIEDGKASFRIKLDESLPVRDVVASATKACGECGLRATDVDISVSGGYVRVKADVEAWTGFGEETTATGRLMRPLTKGASGFRQGNTAKEEKL